MRVLILGGTAWLGHRIARSALEAGHEVTCLARGMAGTVPAGASLVRSDRDQRGAYDAVTDEPWDVVVDVSRQPGQVLGGVTALSGRVGFMVYVSSGNVYADHEAPGQDETAAVLPALDGDVMETMETYGEAKVACEQHVLAGYGADRSLLARVGLIGGPGDLFDRSGYWPWRFGRPAAADGRVLVPDAPDEATQVIDVRDLAGWLVTAGTQFTSGIFNAGGETRSLAEHLAVARTVARHSGPVIAADPDWLRAHDVQPWMGPRSLPLWLGDPAWAGFNARSSRKARSAGLVTRPLADTLADTLVWELTRKPAPTRQAGLSDTDERALLDLLTADQRAAARIV